MHAENPPSEKGLTGNSCIEDQCLAPTASYLNWLKKRGITKLLKQHIHRSQSANELDFQMLEPYFKGSLSSPLLLLFPRNNPAGSYSMEPDERSLLARIIKSLGYKGTELAYYWMDPFRLESYEAPLFSQFSKTCAFGFKDHKMNAHNTISLPSLATILKDDNAKHTTWSKLKNLRKPSQ